MADVSFADNLYRDIPSLAGTGCGLFGVCRNGAWFYERHSDQCDLGKWLVGVTACEAGEFGTLLDRRKSAVVDDFGNLRMVEPSHG